MCVLNSGNFAKSMALPKASSLSLLYAWFRLYIGYMVLESLLTIVPNRLVRHLDPDPLQATERVRFEWKHFLITVRRLLPYESISTMNSESVWLANVEIIISRERSQHFLLKGRSSGIELMLCKCTWVCDNSY